MSTGHYAVHTVNGVVIAILIHLLLTSRISIPRTDQRVDTVQRNIVQRKLDKLYSKEVIKEKTLDEATPRQSDYKSDVKPQKSGRDPVLMYKESVQSSGTSVWCHGNNHTDRMCRFRNLCYHPGNDAFLFFHGNGSLYYGLPDNRFNPALLDMSTVQDHNMNFFSYVDIPADKIRDFNVTLIETTSFIMKRFNSDNIMHVLHDDLLPLYHTLSMVAGGNRINGSGFEVQLVFIEGWEKGAFFELYRVMSAYEPMLKRDLQGSDRLTCFTDVYIGLSKHTLWYQYGFKIPQGPLSNLRVTSREVRHFTNFIRERYITWHPNLASNSQYAVLLSRKHNRLILNEMDLSLAIVMEFKIKVVTLSLETHSAADIITFISAAHMLFGMHGSLLSFAMFLRPGAMLIELFPYAVNPSHYTPYKTLCSLRGMYITYRSWRNVDISKTVPHPNEAWDVGGIIHLSAEEQSHILSSKEVPQHLCCRDPHWLFRIYQDTVVDLPSFLEVVKSAVGERDKLVANSKIVSTYEQLFPSLVLNLTCQTRNTNPKGKMSSDVPNLWLSWKQPWNLEFLERGNVEYEVWIQGGGQDYYNAYIVPSSPHVVSKDIKNKSLYKIWVRCIHNGTIKGPFNTQHVTCDT